MHKHVMMFNSIDEKDKALQWICREIETKHIDACSGTKKLILFTSPFTKEEREALIKNCNCSSYHVVI